MKILVTGATGYLGHQLTLTLAERGNSVQVLVRNPLSANIPSHKNIVVFTGDITNRQSIKSAMRGCEQVYHTAALVKIFAANAADFYKVNVEGTQHLLAEALCAGVKKFVFTSSCGVLGTSVLEPKCENDPRTTGFENDYEFTKFIAESLVKEYIYKGLVTVIVSPSKVYGPGIETHPVSVNHLIRRFIKGRATFIPSPGKLLANYCFIDDVVEGHILAMAKGVGGEKYILGGADISYSDFFKTVRSLSGSKATLIKAPQYIAKLFALLQWVQFIITRKEPFATLKGVKSIFCNKTFSSKKAIGQLGYHLTPLEEGLQQTIHFLKTQNHVS